VNEKPSASGRRAWWSWIRISEVVGVAAVIIAILNFWDNHTERRLAEKAQAVADQRAAAAPAFVLVGTADADGGRIRLSPVHPDQPIQSQVFFFPADIRDKPVETTGAARIEASWIDSGLRKAAGKSGGDGGDLRLPVGVSTTYLADGDTRTDNAVYDIGYRLEHRFLRPDRVVLEGLSSVRRGVRGDLRAASEQLYRSRQGAKAQ
jgi:hypothetical protein